MTVRPCWECRQPATHIFTREGSNTLHACDRHTRIDRPEAESRGWTVTRLGRPITLTKTAVTLYDIESNRAWRTMSHRDGEHEVRLCYGLGDVVQEYETTDREGRPIRVVYQIDAPREYAEPDQGGVYVFSH